MTDDPSPRRLPPEHARGLPPEYGRVTNPERFRRLHDVAVDLLDRAASRYLARRIDGYGADAELEASLTLARATVVLKPDHVDEGAIAVAFTTFPGLRVRFGRWCCLTFPACGCDACGETGDDECARFTSLAGNLIAGRFREAIVRTDADTAWYEWESWEGVTRQKHREPLVGDDVRLRTARDGVRHDWRAWSPRPGGTS